jgi:integrase
LAAPKAPATVRQVHIILSGALRQARKWGGWPVADIVDRLTSPTVHARKPKAIPRLELSAIYDLAVQRGYQGDVMSTAFQLARLLGCREGELCALRWSYVSSKTSLVTIDKSVTKLNGTPLTEEDTKSHPARQVPLGPKGLAVVTHRRQVQEDEARRGQVKLVDDPYLLSRALDGSEQCLPSGLSQGFTKLVDLLWPRERGPLKPDGRKGDYLSKPRWHFHQIRHRVGTTLAHELLPALLGGDIEA